MNNIVFRPATLADSEKIASLHTTSWRDAYRGILTPDYLAGPIAEEQARYWLSRLSSPGDDRRYILLAEAEGRLVAFACVLLDEEPLWGARLDNLHVLPELKGRGLGRKLFAGAVRWVMSNEPAWPIHLWVFEANDGARRFYDMLGGQVVEYRIKQAPGGLEIPCLRYVWRDLRALLNKLESAPA